jgi:hypothetical protein
MNASPLTSIYDRWTRPSYERRVRAHPPPSAPQQSETLPRTFLWGSVGISEPIFFDKPLILHIRNDLFGDEVTIYTLPSKTQTPIAILQPGECVSIQVQNMTGVYATCPTETVVACLIRE